MFHILDLVTRKMHLRKLGLLLQSKVSHNLVSVTQETEVCSYKEWNENPGCCILSYCPRKKKGSKCFSVIFTVWKHSDTSTQEFSSAKHRDLSTKSSDLKAPGMSFNKRNLHWIQICNHQSTVGHCSLGSLNLHNWSPSSLYSGHLLQSSITLFKNRVPYHEAAEHSTKSSQKAIVRKAFFKKKNKTNIEIGISRKKEKVLFLPNSFSRNSWYFQSVSDTSIWTHTVLSFTNSWVLLN